MSKKQYAELEKHIIETLVKEDTFEYDSTNYTVLSADKPRPHGGNGECKTDVYAVIKNIDTEDTHTLKISVKTEGRHEFEENKVSPNRAEQMLGTNWSDIIQEAALQIKDLFESQELLYPEQVHPTKANSITVGWKLEVANKERTLSAPLPLTKAQIRDYVYKGTNQSEDKVDSFVDGHVVEESGIADYMLVTSIEHITSPSDILDQLEPIDSYEVNDTYLIFTANNYRTDVDTADGKRPLAVRIEWDCIDGKLTPNYKYDSPLVYTGGGDMAPLVKAALAKLGKKNIEALDPETDISNPALWHKK